MKKIFTILGIVSVSAIMNAQTEVLNESFSFNGFLNTNNNGWYQHSGTINQLSANGSVVTLSSANSEDSNKALSTAYSLSTASTSYKIEYSVDVTALNSTTLTTAGDYFLSLTGTVTTSDVTTGISALPARLYIKAGTTGFLLGVVNNSGTGSAANFITTETPYGTVVNAKVVYEVTKDAANAVTLQKASLTVGSETISNTSGAGAPPAQIAGIAIREAGTTATTGNLTLDNIIVNTYTPVVLAVSDINSIKANFIRNTVVNNEITFGAKANVKVYNMNGQLMKSAAVEKDGTLNVSSFVKGTYVVAGEVNGQKVVQKVIKQ